MAFVPALVLATLGLLVAPTQCFAAQKITEENVPVDGKIGLVPSRAETDVEPGKTTTVPARLINRTGETVTIRISVGDLEASPDPGTFVRLVRNAEFGAGSWVRPEIDVATIEHGQRMEFSLFVTPPKDAPVGSHYAGLQAVVEQPAGTGDARVDLSVAALGQLLFNVPGDIRRGGEITRIKPSDTLFFGGSFVDRFFGGPPFVSYDISYRNTGNVTEHLSGEIVVKSMFGNAVRTFTIPRKEARIVLRGSTGTIRVLWADPPAFGRFTAEARLETDDGPKEKNSPPVTILPPWWWILLLLVALAVPLLLRWWRNRTDWQQYLDDDVDDDGDWQTGPA